MILLNIGDGFNPVIAAMLSLLGVLVTGIVSFYVGRRNYSKENWQAITIKLWERREENYQRLMQVMEALPLYPNKQDKVVWEDLLELSKEFRSWYFQGGGLYLTDRSRKAYMDFQEFVELHCPKTTDEKFSQLLKDTTIDTIEQKKTKRLSIFSKETKSVTE